MGAPKTIGACAVTSGTPTPVLFAAANSPFPSFSISIVTWNKQLGICTVTISGTFPTTGFNGPNGYQPTPPPTSQNPAPPVYNLGQSANGQQVVIWGCTGGTSQNTLLNGKKITILNSNPVAKTFSFYFSAFAATASFTVAESAGKVAPIPVQKYRVLRLEVGQGNGSDFVYVGDGNVSSARCIAALSLTGQVSFEVAGDNIPAEGIFIDGTNTTTDVVEVSLIY
jgi:hypothetical protein